MPLPKDAIALNQNSSGLPSDAIPLNQQNSVTAPVAQAYQQAQSAQYPYAIPQGAGMNSLQGMQAASAANPEAYKAFLAQQATMPGDIQKAALTKQAEIAPTVQGAVAEKQATEKLTAQQGQAKDAVTYGLLKGIGNDLMGYYDTAYKNHLAGSPQNEWAAQQLSGTVPDGKLSVPFAARPLGDMMPKDAMSAVGKMQSASNELILRLQPFLSESLDKDGTNRILQSMLQMSKSEVPALGNERNAAIGKLIGTLRTVKRFTNASGDYTDLINKMSATGDDTDLNNAIQKVMSSPKANLSDSDEKFFSNLEKQYQNKFSNMPKDTIRMQDAKGNQYDVPTNRRLDSLKLGWKEQ